MVRRLRREDDNLLRLTTYRRSTSLSRNAFSDFPLIEMSKFCLPEGISAETSGRTINSESFVQQSDLNRIALSVRLKRQSFIAVELHGELGGDMVPRVTEHVIYVTLHVSRSTVPDLKPDSSFLENGKRE